jgi:hypothetical protein
MRTAKTSDQIRRGNHNYHENKYHSQIREAESFAFTRNRIKNLLESLSYAQDLLCIYPPLSMLAITKGRGATWIDKLRIEVVSQLRYPRSDLVELHALLLAVALNDVHGECARSTVGWWQQGGMRLIFITFGVQRFERVAALARKTRFTPAFRIGYSRLEIRDRDVSPSQNWPSRCRALACKWFKSLGLALPERLS